MKVKIHCITTSGDVTSNEVDRKTLTSKYMADVVCARQHIELASVLFNGKPATMVVDETGAVQPGAAPPNTRATAIYWTGTIIGRTGVPFDPLTMPMIHGQVLLIEMDKRKL